MRHTDNYSDFFKSNFNKIAFFLAFYGMLYSNFVFPAQNLVLVLSNVKPNIDLHNIESETNPSGGFINSVSMINNSIVSDPGKANIVVDRVDALIFYPDINVGTIGIDPDLGFDNAGDNYFNFTIDQSELDSYSAYLSYDILGTNNIDAVSRSINGRYSCGGFLVKQHNEWITLNEEINISWLKEGKNTVSFSLDRGSSYFYKIKNVRLRLEKNTSKNKIVIPNDDFLRNEKNEVYLKGFIREFNSTQSVLVNDTPINCTSGEFEGFFKTDNLKKNELSITLYDNQIKIEERLIKIKSLTKADISSSLTVPNYSSSMIFEPGKEISELQIDGAKIAILPGSINQQTKVAISKLRSIDIAPLNPELINVTKNLSAYRFTPDGFKFDSLVRISIGYDSTLIPSGYTINDIRTYYFNTITKNWEEILFDSIDRVNAVVISQTDHFTDYINGIVQVPESPQGTAFVPTMMNDIKIADPASNITLINPPSASQTGEAAVTYPIKVPSGRKGIQPELTLQYNSNGGSGWLGQGWNIPIPAITIDTRWGVPNLNNQTETEIYTLNGEQLMYPKIEIGGEFVDWMPNRHYGKDGVLSTEPRNRIEPANAFFTFRKQGDFSRIQRLGNSPSTYYWKVIQTDGTIYWYGGKSVADVNNNLAVIKNESGGVVHWALFRVEDVHGNYMEYTYNYGNVTQPGALSGGHYFYPATIKYTGNNITGKSPKYEVCFNTNKLKPRTDATINAKLGLKQVDPYSLSDIKIYYNTRDTLVRGYAFDLVEGRFSKNLLNSVSEIDADNQIFYTHTFEYYDDIAEGGYYTKGEETGACDDKCFHTKINIQDSGFSQLYRYSFDINYEQLRPGCSNLTAAKFGYLILNSDTIRPVPDNQYLTHYTDSWTNLCPSTINYNQSPGDPCVQNVNFVPNFTNWISSALSSVMPENISFTNQSGVYNYGRDTVSNVTGLVGEFTSEQDFDLKYLIQFPFQYAKEYFGGAVQTIDSVWTATDITISISSSAGIEVFGPYTDFLNPAVIEQFENDLRQKYEGYPYPEVTTSETSSVEIDFPATELDFYSITVTSQSGSTNFPFAMCYEGIGKSFDLPINAEQMKISNFPPLKSSFDRNLLQRYNIRTLSSGMTADTCNPITNIRFKFPINTPSYKKAGSLLGGTAGYSANIGGYIGIGIGTDIFSKSNTLGLQANFGWNRNETFTTLEDIDGDGLDDIIIKKDESLVYKKHLIVNNSHTFSVGKPLLNIDNLFKQTGKNLSGNLQGTCKFGFAGIDKSFNWSETSIYMTDANSDGLLDVAKDGIVYFNQQNESGDITFLPQSDSTENMIITGAVRTENIPGQILVDSIDYPVCDIVKIWEAPADGKIMIYDTIQLLDPEKPSQVTIEKLQRNALCYNTAFPIPYTDFSYHVYTPFLHEPAYDFNTHQCDSNSIILIEKLDVNNQTYLNDPPSLYLTHWDFGHVNLCNTCPSVPFEENVVVECAQNLEFQNNFRDFITNIFSGAPYYGDNFYVNNLSGIYYTKSDVPEIPNDTNTFTGFVNMLNFTSEFTSTVQLTGSITGHNITDDYEPNYVYDNFKDTIIQTTTTVPCQIWIHTSVSNRYMGNYDFYYQSEVDRFELDLNTAYSSSSPITVVKVNDNIQINVSNSDLEFLTLEIRNINETYLFDDCTSDVYPIKSYVNNYQLDSLDLQLAIKKSIASGDIEKLPITHLSDGSFLISSDDKSTSVKKINLSKISNEVFIQSLKELRKQSKEESQAYLEKYYNTTQVFKSPDVKIFKEPLLTKNTLQSTNLSLLYGTTLTDDESIRNAIETNVKKGDTIYFRTHSIENGNSPVEWNPKIEYINESLQNIFDQNGKKQYVSYYSDGFILSAIDTVYVTGTGEANFSWPAIDVNNLTDQVSFIIDRTDEEIDSEGNQISYTTQNIYEHQVPANSTNLPNLTANVPVQTLGGHNVITSFSFRAYSNSNVDWKKIEWHPCVNVRTYEEIIGKDSIVEDTLEIFETKFPVVDYQIYKKHTKTLPYSNFDLSEMGGYSIVVSPYLTNSTFEQSDNGTLYLTIKYDNKLVGSIVIEVNNGAVTCQPEVLNLGSFYNEDIEISYFTDDSKLQNGQRSLLEALSQKADGIVDMKCNETGLHKYLKTDKVNLYHKPNQQYGPMYRNWGQFMYNPSLDTNPVSLPNGLAGNFINTSLLKVSESEVSPIQVAETELNGFSFNVDDTTAFQNIFDNGFEELTKRPFIQARAIKSLNEDELFLKWIGVHEECYASAKYSRAADYSQTYTGYINEQTNLTQLGDIKTGAYSIPKKSEGSSTNLSAGTGIISASKSISGKNNSYSDYFDMNGDGYPEIVTKDEVQKSTRTGGLNSPTNNPFGALSKTKSSSLGVSACNSFAISGEDETTANTKPNASAGISGSLSSGEDNTTILWFDINGDGLPDKYQLTESGIKVELNTGDGFNLLPWQAFNPSQNTTSSIGGGLGINLKKGSIEAGYSASNCLSSSISMLQDFNGDGFVDLFIKGESGFLDVYLNTGTSFATDPIKLEQFNLYENSESISNSLNAGFSLSLIWPLLFVTLKAPCINLNGQIAETNNRTKKVFKDFDGDGYIDYLEELTPSKIKVYYSRIARTNKLKTVTNPLNGSFTIDYKANPKSYDNPNSLWVMSEIMVNDGLEKMEIAQHGKSVYTKRFSYEGSKYDRRERAFLGFKKVITHDIDSNKEIYRSQASEYLNDSYFTQTLIKKSKVYKKNDEKALYSSITNEYVIRGLVSETLPTGSKLDNMAIDTNSNLGLLYDVGGCQGRGTAIVMLMSTQNDYYNESDTPLITSRVTFDYDTLGRISRYSNFGDFNDNNDNYISDIHYYSDDNLKAKNIRTVADTITVKVWDESSSKFVLKRQRMASHISPTGLVKTITTDISGDIFGSGTTVLAVTDMDFDANGNIISITFPENDSLQRVSYGYSYDAENAKYITEIKDLSLGYITKMFYNPKFDVVRRVVDITGNETHYYYDSKGRVTRIAGPNEIKRGGLNPYTIKFQYLLQNPCEAPNFVPCAITKHFDILGAGDDIETYNFVDGLGRVIQVKKDIVVNTAVNHKVPPAYVQGMSVSGWATYDEFGRKTDQYLPTWDPTKDCKVIAGLNIDLVQGKSTTSYDQLDRALVYTDPELHSTTNEYTFENRKFKTKTIILKNQADTIVKYTLADLSGKITKSVNTGNQGDYVTLFEYDPIGELVSSTDPSGLLSRYYYDNRGLTIGYSHPDMGLTNFKYDKAGNIVSKDSRQFDKIVYKYHFNQLSRIVYPSAGGTHNISDVTYKYGSPSAGNDAGKITKQTDATGIQEFRYGNMGEVIFNNRTVQYGTYSNSYITQFVYDSWNRIMQISYPGTEVVNYYYNKGGNLYIITNNDSYSYLARSDYNYFGELTYQKYGNNTETVYTYTDKLRRLNNIDVDNSLTQHLMNPVYSYDYIGNITGINNQGTIIGNFSMTEARYDLYNRLISATGNFSDPVQHNSSSYNLSGVVYGSSGEIIEKNQSHILQGSPNPLNSYNNKYDYVPSSHKISQIKEQASGRVEQFSYDLNGNIAQRSILNIQLDYNWDEENRLRSFTKKDKLSETTHLYYYDASGERIMKIKAAAAKLYQNSDLKSSELLLRDYTVYPSAFITQSDLKTTKHYYAGSKRIASRIEMKPATEPRLALDSELKLKQETDLEAIAKKLGCDKFKYEFSKYDVESEETEDTTLRADVSSIFFYHPDHLGTSTVVSNASGTLHQYFFNLPFGETMIEGCTNSTYQLNYKFNAKELDTESGMYYYGARYYDPRISVWMSVDPMAYKYPNLSPYCFSGNNPINIIDPNGKYIFGLFGSTKEQRAAAREFAEKHNGTIKKIYSNDISVEYQRGGSGPEAEIIADTKHFYRESFKGQKSQAGFLKWFLLKIHNNGSGSDGGERGGAPLTTNKGGDRQGPAISTKGETDQPINIDNIAALTSPPNERTGTLVDVARVINDWTNLAGILGYGEEEERSCSGDIKFTMTDTIYTNAGRSISKTSGSIHYNSIEDSIKAVNIIHDKKNTVIYE